MIPSVEVMLDLHWKRLLRIARFPRSTSCCGGPSRRAGGPAAVLGDDLLRTSGRSAPGDRRPAHLRAVRCPLLAVELKHKGGWAIESIEPISIREVRAEQRQIFAGALDRYTQRPGGRRGRCRPHAGRSPSCTIRRRSCRHRTRRRSKICTGGRAARLRRRSDHARRLRAPRRVRRAVHPRDHGARSSYRFARKAESEGMPVIDDPRSILKCTNKIYLAELLQANNVPCPRTLILDRRRIGRIERGAGIPGGDQDPRRFVLAASSRR